MTWRVVLSKEAKRGLLHAHQAQAARISAALLQMAQLPFGGDCKKIQGVPNQWRRRVGEWRILFTTSALDSVVLILKIAPRDSAYKK